MSAAASLLAEIFARPEDDAPRLVYADLLLELGDLRGELIQLQFQRHGQSGARARVSEREEELLAHHVEQWLGPLRFVVAQPRFERGFLESCALRRATGEPVRWREAIDHPFWSTVTELQVGRDGGDWVREVLIQPRLGRLRRAWDVPPDRLAELCDSDLPWSLEEVECNLMGRPLGASLRPIAECRALTSLRRLRLDHFADHPDARDHQWLASSALLARLEVLTLGTSRMTLLGGWARLLAAAPRLGYLILAGDQVTAAVWLARGDDGRLSRLVMEYSADQLGDLLAALRSLDDDALTSIQLMGESPSRAAREQLAEATRRFGSIDVTSR